MNKSNPLPAEPSILFPEQDRQSCFPLAGDHTFPTVAAPFTRGSDCPEPVLPIPGGPVSLWLQVTDAWAWPVITARPGLYHQHLYPPDRIQASSWPSDLTPANPALPPQRQKPACCLRGPSPTMASNPPPAGRQAQKSRRCSAPTSRRTKGCRAATPRGGQPWPRPAHVEPEGCTSSRRLVTGSLLQTQRNSRGTGGP